MHLQKKEVVDTLIRDFEASLESQADRLDGLKKDLPEAFEDYRITVHAMKSVSGSIGLISLSGMAAVLEKAASKEDEDTVNRLHDVFIMEWKSCREGLQE